MNNTIRVAAVAAVVVIAAVLTINLLPRGGTGGPTSTPTAVPSASPVPSAAAEANPCDLLTNAEAAEALRAAGLTLNPPEITSEESTQDNRYCFYHGSGPAFAPGTDPLSISWDTAGGAAAFAQMKAGSGVEAVTGLGDDALWLTAQKILVILKGDAEVSLYVGFGSTLDPATQLAAAKAIGAIIASRM